MAKAETSQVKDNKHSSGVRGIAEAVSALRQFEIVQTAKVGRIVEQGGVCDAFKLKPRADDQNNNVITILFIRTDGCQEVWVTFKPSSSGLNEKIRILGNLLKQKYPKFQLKDFPELQEVQVPETPAVSTVKIPLLQAPVLEPNPTPEVLPVEIVKGDDMVIPVDPSVEKRVRVVELTLAQANAYQKFRDRAVQKNNELRFQGSVFDMRNYVRVLIEQGLIVHDKSSGFWLVNDFEIKIIKKVTKPSAPKTVSASVQIQAETKLPNKLPNDLFKDPKALKIYLLRLLVKDQAGRLRSADDLSAALLAVDEVREVLQEIDKHWKVFSEILPLLHL